VKEKLLSWWKQYRQERHDRLSGGSLEVEIGALLFITFTELFSWALSGQAWFLLLIPLAFAALVGPEIYWFGKWKKEKRHSSEG